MYWFTSSNENGPGFNYGQLLVVHGAGDTIAQIAWDYFTNKMVFRTGNPPETGGSRTWNEWKPVSIADPPQVFDVPLANGFSPQTTHSCYYCKTQESIVLLNVASIGDVQANVDVVIGTLPAGCRPAVVCRSAATNHFSPYGVGAVSIGTDGTITVRFTEMQSRCNFIASFVAS